MPPSDTELGTLLLARARQAIAHHLGLGEPPPPEPALAERGATFVTLTKDGELRGCIGSLRPQRSLAEDVAANAVGACRDPRFPPLAATEFPLIRIEVSLLSAPDFLAFADEAGLLSQLRPGEDGLILFAGCRSATFLPQVWSQLPEPARFLAALKHKLGLAADHPAERLMAARYSVRKWMEDGAESGVAKA